MDVDSVSLGSGSPSFCLEKRNRDISFTHVHTRFATFATDATARVYIKLYVHVYALAASKIAVYLFFVVKIISFIFLFSWLAATTKIF